MTDTVAERMTAGWQLDEEGARAYERELVPALMAMWASHLVDAAQLRTAERVLDVACGTGIVARRAFERVGTDGAVAAVDVSPAMVTVARDVCDQRIGIDVAPAEDLPFADGAFDVCLCQQGVQFIADRGRAVDEMHRVTAPGGRVALMTCRAIEHQPGYRALADTIERHLGIDAAAIVRSPYAFGGVEPLRDLLASAGFGPIRVTIEITPLRFPSAEVLLMAETTGSPLGSIVEQLDDDVRAGLLTDLRASLAPYTDDDGVTFPFETLTAVARR